MGTEIFSWVEVLDPQSNQWTAVHNTFPADEWDRQHCNVERRPIEVVPSLGWSAGQRSCFVGRSFSRSSVCAVDPARRQGVTTVPFFYTH